MKIYTFEGKKNICGDRIREARTNIGLSQFELAARMQLAHIAMERITVTKIETGERLIADFELRAFAEVLGVDVNWLLGRDEDK